MLNGKTVYLITIGQMPEKENEEIVNKITEYFCSVGEFMKFEVKFLKNLSSGEDDDITQNYDNYDEIIQQMKKVIRRKYE